MTEAPPHPGSTFAPAVAPPVTNPTNRAVVGAFELRWADGPVSLLAPSSPLIGRRDVALVEIFTADEQRARTSQAYFRTAVGERLRVASSPQIFSDEDAVTAVVVQRDSVSGLEVTTTVTAPVTARAVRIENRIRNVGAEPVTLTAVSSATVGVGRAERDLDGIAWGSARSEWLAENRWRETPLSRLLPDLALDLTGQDGRGHAHIASHGAWSTGEHLPTGYLVAGDGNALGWQIESSAGWQADVCRTRQGAVISLLGPTDLEHHFAHELLPGEEFAAVPAALCASASGKDGVIGELTRYRRWLRGGGSDAALPVVYNDFMNTLMGQPSTEALLPLIRRAAAAGSEVFCIDAGWFADPAIGDWWSTVGEWREASARFAAGGLRHVIDEIVRHGMIPGLWLEPEVVGVDSPAAAVLPDAAFFKRFGRRVQEDRRYHLDFRHPAARAHVDAAVDRLVETFAIGFVKLDYNINPGAGTEHGATAAGDGLLGHVRAYRDWLVQVQRRHPQLRVENCSSGAMRADYGMLAVTHLQSTSDQQDFRLYPPIAASAPASILPEQCGNWAYPAADMSDEETVFTLVTGLSGRLYLSGFLDNLREPQRERIAEAVSLHKELRDDLGDATPFWPLGLPAWDATTVCLGLHTRSRDLLFVWDRDPSRRILTIPSVGGARVLFPHSEPPQTTWEIDEGAGDLSITTSAGIGARVLEVVRHG